MAIISSLKKELILLGITTGDTICVSSDVGAIGIPEELKDEMKKHGSKILLKSYVETLLDIVGVNGSVLMPTFSYSATQNEIYNPETTKSTVGTLTEWFRKAPGVRRNNHTIFSYASIGPLTKEVMQSNMLDSFGDNSVFDLLYQKNAKYLLLGIDMIRGSTNVYFSEQRNKVSYRYFKFFTGTLETEDSIENIQVRYFVRDYEYNYMDDWSRLQTDAINENVAQISSFNGVPLITYRAKEIERLIASKLAKDAHYLIKIK